MDVPVHPAGDAARSLSPAEAASVAGTLIRRTFHLFTNVHIDGEGRLVQSWTDLGGVPASRVLRQATAEDRAALLVLGRLGA